MKTTQARAYYDVHLGKKRTFLGGAWVKAEVETLPYYSNNQDIGDYRYTAFSGGIGLRQSLGINNHVGADLYYKTATIKLAENIKEVLPGFEYHDKFQFHGPELAFIYERNTYNSNYYPIRGSNVRVIYQQAFSTTFITEYDPDSLGIENEYIEYLDPYWHVTLDLENYLPLGKKVSLNSEFAMGLSDNE